MLYWYWRAYHLYQLGVEFGQAWLAGIIEDQDCVDHGVDVVVVCRMSCECVGEDDQ